MSDAKYCYSCGTALVPGAGFCGKCGAAVAAQAPVQPPAQARVQTPPPAQAPVQAPGSTRSRGPLILGLFVLGVVIVTAAAIALILRGGAKEGSAGTDVGAEVTPVASATLSLPPETGSPTSQGYGAVVPEGWQACANALLGYSIGYPGGWYTTDRVKLPNGRFVRKPLVSCNFFNPAPFQIWWGTEPPTTALVVESERQGLQGTVLSRSDPRYLAVLSRKDTTVAGMPAVQLEVSQVGEGYYPKGTLEYMYVVGLDPGHTLVVSTMFFPGSRVDYPAYKAIVDQAVQTVTLLH